MNQEKLRAVTMFYDKDGCPVGRSVLSPSENTTRALCIVPPDEVFPVIFVPGIMGSNLRFKVPIKEFNQGKDIAWRPDDIWHTAWLFANLEPAQRRLILDPETPCWMTVPRFPTASFRRSSQRIRRLVKTGKRNMPGVAGAR